MDAAHAKTDKYEKLKGLQRPAHDGDAFSLRHPKMPLSRRAKIFQPFDALRGFDAAVDIAREGTCLIEKRELDEGEVYVIGQKLQRVTEVFRRNRRIRRCTSVSVTHFAPEEERDGIPIGRYRVTKGDLTAISIEGGYLLVDGERIRFGDVTDIAAV